MDSFLINFCLQLTVYQKWVINRSAQLSMYHLQQYNMYQERQRYPNITVVQQLVKQQKQQGATKYFTTYIENQPQTLVIIEQNNKLFLGFRQILWVTNNSTSHKIIQDFKYYYQIKINIVDSIQHIFDNYLYDYDKPYDIWVSDISNLLQANQKLIKRKQIKGFVLYDISVDHQQLQAFNSIKNQINLSQKFKFASQNFDYVGQNYRTQFGVPDFMVINKLSQTIPMRHILKSMANRQTNRKQIINIFCHICQENGFPQLKQEIINAYQKSNYKLDQSGILRLYKKQSMFYPILNKILRSSFCSTQIFVIQPFFQDLFHAIKKCQYKNSNLSKFTCYRGGKLTNNELKIMKIGNVVQNLGFLSASLAQYQAKVNFAKNAFFVIQVDSSEQNEYYDQGFVKPSNYIQILQSQQQVIFNPLNYFIVNNIILPKENQKYITVYLKYGQISKIMNKYDKNKNINKQQQDIVQLIIKPKQLFDPSISLTQGGVLKIQKIFNGNIFNQRYAHFVNEYKKIHLIKQQTLQYHLKQLKYKINITQLQIISPFSINQQKIYHLGQQCIRLFQQFYHKYFEHFNCQQYILQTKKQMQKNIMSIKCEIIERGSICVNILLCQCKMGQKNKINWFKIFHETVQKMLVQVDNQISNDNNNRIKLSILMDISRTLNQYFNILQIMKVNNGYFINNVIINQNKQYQKLLKRTINQTILRYCIEIHNIFVKFQKLKCSQMKIQQQQNLIIERCSNLKINFINQCSKQLHQTTSLIANRDIQLCLQRINNHLKNHGRICRVYFLFLITKMYALSQINWPFQKTINEIQAAFNQLSTIINKENYFYQLGQQIIHRFYLKNGKLAQNYNFMDLSNMEVYKKHLQKILKNQQQYQKSQYSKIIFQFNFQKINNSYLQKQQYENYIKNMLLCTNVRQYLNNPNYYEIQYLKQMSRASLICLISKNKKQQNQQNIQIFIKQCITNKIMNKLSQNIINFMQSICCIIILIKQTPLILNRYFQYLTHIKFNTSLQTKINKQKIAEIQQQFENSYNIYKDNDEDLMKIINQPQYYIIKLSQYILSILIDVALPMKNVQMADVKILQSLILLGNQLFYCHQSQKQKKKGLKYYLLNYMQIMKNKQIKFQPYQHRIMKMLEKIASQKLLNST